MTKIYTGIGSRETPASVCVRMTAIAQRLRERGFLLRSGAAEGADEAFEAGAEDLKEIWVPYVGFRGHPSRLVPTFDAFDMAAKFHPAWHRCSPAARRFHARNVHQVLGVDLKTPTSHVICWTKDGKASGGDSVDRFRN